MTTKGFTATETIVVGLINCYQCPDCQRVVDCLTPPESKRCPECRGEEPHFEKVRPNQTGAINPDQKHVGHCPTPPEQPPPRECDFCGKPTGDKHRITRLTTEQRQALAE